MRVTESRYLVDWDDGSTASWAQGSWVLGLVFTSLVCPQPQMCAGHGGRSFGLGIAAWVGRCNFPGVG